MGDKPPAAMEANYLICYLQLPSRNSISSGFSTTVGAQKTLASGLYVTYSSYKRVEGICFLRAGRPSEVCIPRKFTTQVSGCTFLYLRRKGWWGGKGYTQAQPIPFIPPLFVEAFPPPELTHSRLRGINITLHLAFQSLSSASFRDRPSFIIRRPFFSTTQFTFN